MSKRMRIVSVHIATTIVVLLASSGPAAAKTVCIQYLDGYRCEVFLEPRPSAPGNTRGMKVTITPSVLTPTNELAINAGPFRKGETVRTWVYNIFGQGRMSELTNVHAANGKGRVSIAYAPSTTLYNPSWGAPAICMRGERSLKLACAQFTVAGDSGTVTDPAPGNPAPATPASTQAPAPQPASTPASTLDPNCRDVGFTILCTS